MELRESTQLTWISLLSTEGYDSNHNAKGNQPRAGIYILTRSTPELGKELAAPRVLSLLEERPRTPIKEGAKAHHRV